MQTCLLKTKSLTSPFSDLYACDDKAKAQYMSYPNDASAKLFHFVTKTNNVLKDWYLPLQKGGVQQSGYKGLYGHINGENYLFLRDHLLIDIRGKFGSFKRSVPGTGTLVTYHGLNITKIYVNHPNQQGYFNRLSFKIMFGEVKNSYIQNDSEITITIPAGVTEMTTDLLVGLVSYNSRTTYGIMARPYYNTGKENDDDMIGFRTTARWDQLNGNSAAYTIGVCPLQQVFYANKLPLDLEDRK